MSNKKIAIIASKGSLDWGYPPFLYAATAHALGYECRMFFTFGGLHLIKRDLRPCMNLIGNPGIPTKLPVFLRFLPGIRVMATHKAEQRLKENGLASLEELRQTCIDAKIPMYACQMTAELLGCAPSDLVDEAMYGGAATFFDFAGESDICLFI